MSTTKQVAIIGLGNIGKVIASNLVKGNRSVILANRTFEKVESLAKQLGSLATASEITEAIKEAEIIILPIMFHNLQEFLKEYAAELQNKIIIDPSNPVSIDEKGNFTKLIGEQESAGQVISQALPNGAKLVKAWCTLGVDTLINQAFQETEQAVLFYATDNTDIDADIKQLIQDTGFEPFNVGGIDQSIRLELFGDLNEFALRKTLTTTEAQNKI
nr:NAD(P)-binding domain-containing protein [uncultured Draconibacterium sp.]